MYVCCCVLLLYNLCCLFCEPQYMLLFYRIHGAQGNTTEELSYVFLARGEWGRSGGGTGGKKGVGEAKGEEWGGVGVVQVGRKEEGGREGLVGRGW